MHNHETSSQCNTSHVYYDEVIHGHIHYTKMSRSRQIELIICLSYPVGMLIVI